MEPMGGSSVACMIILPVRSMTSTDVFSDHWLGNAMINLDSEADHAIIGRCAVMMVDVSLFTVVVSPAMTGSIQRDVFIGLVGW